MIKTTQWLWLVARKKILYVAALTVIQSIIGGAGVLYALLMRNIVDSAVNREPEAFWYYVTLDVSLLIAMLAMSALIRWLRELARNDIENLFKLRLVNNILSKEYSSVSSTHSAEWLNRLTSDCALVAKGYVDILPGLVGTVVRLLSSVVMLVALDRWIVNILLPAGIVVILLTYSFRKVLKRMHKEIRESDGRLRTFLQERISSLMVIKSFAGEKQVSGKASEKMQDFKAARMKRHYFSNFCNTGFGAAMSGLSLIGLVHCAQGIMTGRITYGTFTAVMQLIGQVQSPFASVSGYLPRWYAMVASAERLQEIENLPDDGPVADRETIRSYYAREFQCIGLHHACFSYKQKDNKETPVVLNGLDLELHKNEYVAFTGHSGCGKSTVLKLFMSMYPLNSGERYIDGEPLTAYHRRMFAYVPQGNALMNGTIREIISFAEPEAIHDDERLKKALEISCADEFVDNMDAVLGERGSGLSEGQMQRITIARAIFADSPILLLDEATSSLDEQTERKLLENLRRMTDKTVVIVTHRKAALSICDRVLHFTEKGVEEIGEDIILNGKYECASSARNRQRGIDTPGKA